MRDLIKALLIGAALVAGVLGISILLAMLVPILSFVALVLGIWLILQISKPDDDDSSPDPPP